MGCFILLLNVISSLGSSTNEIVGVKNNSNNNNNKIIQTNDNEDDSITNTINTDMLATSLLRLRLQLLQVTKFILHSVNFHLRKAIRKRKESG